MIYKTVYRVYVEDTESEDPNMNLVSEHKGTECKKAIEECDTYKDKYARVEKTTLKLAWGDYVYVNSQVIHEN